MGQRTRRFARAMAASAITTLVAAGLSGCGGGTGAQQQETPAAAPAAAPADPRAEAAQNVRLVGYNDLQGRDGAGGDDEVRRRRTAAGSTSGTTRAITTASRCSIRSPGKMEWNGTSILDIADPAKPKLVWHIPNETNRNSRGVSVVYDYKFDGSGRDYLIRNSEALTEGETGTDLKYQIFDITSSDSDPSKISLVVGDHRHAAEFLRPGLRRHVHHARAQRLVVAGDRLLLRRVRRARASATSSSRSSI